MSKKRFDEILSIVAMVVYCSLPSDIVIIVLTINE